MFVTSGYHGVEPADATSNDSFLRLGSNVDLSSDTTPRSTEDFRCGYCNTGDVCVIEPGEHIRIVDRTKDLIKSGGEWISSIEIENIAVGHEKVQEAAVIGIAHPKWDERPLLVVIKNEGAEVSKEEILGYLEGKIAKWWMPDDVVFVDEIPHTATGKIQKLTLRQQFEDYKLPTAEAVAE